MLLYHSAKRSTSPLQTAASGAPTIEEPDESASAPEVEACNSTSEVVLEADRLTTDSSPPTTSAAIVDLVVEQEPTSIDLAPVLPPQSEDEPEDCAPLLVTLGLETDRPVANRAKEAFLALWQRTPEFDSRVVALLAQWQSGPSPFERRRGVERLACELESVCVSSEKRWDTEIRNLSVGGVELLHPEPVPRHTRLALVPKPFLDTVTGRVAWIRPVEHGYRIGLSFDQDPERLSHTWVAETLLSMGSEFLLQRAPRKYVRVPTEVYSTLVMEDGRCVDIVLRDVSMGGCLLHSSEPFELQELVLRLGSVDCHGMVVNSRQMSDLSWSHHVTFSPLGSLEKVRLLRTIGRLLRAP